MNKDHAITLYDLILASGITLSPFVWRVKLAILHKGFKLNAVPTSYMQIKTILDGSHTRLPVIVDGETVVSDSLAIADYLDRAYPDRPSLFRSPGERNFALFLDGWMFQNVVRHWFSCYCLDQVHLSCPEDVEYIRESRERLFLQGRPMEEVVADREQRLMAVRPNLEPLRMLLKDTRWFAGDEPDHIDYLMLSHFLWCASLATFPPLARDDPLFDWINRGFDLFGGIGRDDRLHPLS
jgi:glutathione S-transferase